MRRGWFLPLACTLGFVFLYAPILSLVVFSFNASQLVTVWGGFSTRWYGELCATPRSSAPPGSRSRSPSPRPPSPSCSARSPPS
jgi:ABC-type spermidine/putrescine transport system permease subunit II